MIKDYVDSVIKTYVAGSDRDGRDIGNYLFKDTNKPDRIQLSLGPVTGDTKFLYLNKAQITFLVNYFQAALDLFDKDVEVKLIIKDKKNEANQSESTPKDRKEE